MIIFLYIGNFTGYPIFTYILKLSIISIWIQLAFVAIGATMVSSITFTKWRWRRKQFLAKMLFKSGRILFLLSDQKASSSWWWILIANFVLLFTDFVDFRCVESLIVKDYVSELNSGLLEVIRIVCFFLFILSIFWKLNLWFWRFWLGMWVVITHRYWEY